MPLALVTSTLQAWYTQAGINVIQIGFLGLVAQPYVYKFIWAPILDQRQIAPQIGYRKDWIFCTQILLFISVFGVSYLDPIHHGLIMALAACIIAICSATQDIAIDAYRTEILIEEMRGLGATIAITGYRLGMIISGGLALVLADKIGWSLTYKLNAIMILLGSIGLLIGPQLNLPPQVHEIKFTTVFKDILQRPNIVTILLLVLCYRLGESFTSSMSSLITTFLLRELSLTLTTVGLLTKGVGITATIFGGLIGGFIMTRLPLFNALLYFGIFQAISNLLFIVLAKIGSPSLIQVGLVIGVENICSGLGTAAFIAFLMALCKRPYTAGQFALFSALSATSRVIIAPLSGYIVHYLGWVDYFFISFLASFPAIIIIVQMKRTHFDSQNEKCILQ